MDFFRIARNSLTKDASHFFVVSFRNDSEQIDLNELAKSYKLISDTILFDICDKSIYSIFPNKSKNRDWLELHLRCVKNRLESWTLLTFLDRRETSKGLFYLP